MTNTRHCEPSASEEKQSIRWLFWISLSLIILGLDQLTKWLALTNLVSYESFPLFPGFQFFLAFNTGAAWSFLSNSGAWHTLFFIVISVTVSLFLIISIWRGNNSKWLNLAYSLILGGAIGNLFDRLCRGAVVDFIDVYYKNHHWPIFNIADSAICIGVGVFLYDWWRSQA